MLSYRHLISRSSHPKCGQYAFSSQNHIHHRKHLIFPRLYSYLPKIAAVLSLLFRRARLFVGRRLLFVDQPNNAQQSLAYYSRALCNRRQSVVWIARLVRESRINKGRGLWTRGSRGGGGSARPPVDRHNRATTYKIVALIASRICFVLSCDSTHNLRTASDKGRTECGENVFV